LYFIDKKDAPRFGQALQPFSFLLYHRFLKKTIILFFKPLFQLAIIICQAFITLIIEEQTKRQAVRFPVFDNTITTFAMIRASLFRTSTFFYVRTRHLKSILCFYFNSMQSPQHRGTQVPQPIAFILIVLSVYQLDIAS